MSAQITLSKFQPREYQLPLIDAIENKGYRRVLGILPRRAGKDITGFNLAVRQCIRRPCVVYYIFPTYAQAKKVIWDSVTNDGQRFLDFVPDELIERTNTQEMKIRFTNGSLLQLIGSDRYDTLMGTNPQACVFSEYALQDSRAYAYIRPILTANDGWALFLSTPRGKNALWDMYQIAQNSPQWYCLRLTVDDTQHITREDIEQERADGMMSHDMIMQEYYVSFDMGVENACYGSYMEDLRLKGQITTVPWENAFPVHTAWDLGMRDSTCIIFFQTIGKTIHVIDFYSSSKVGLEHYAHVLQAKPYTYGKHFAPHDINVTEYGAGISRMRKAHDLGIKFSLAGGPRGGKLPIEEGIEAVRSTLPRVWFDEEHARHLIHALENYRYEWDHVKQMNKKRPLHNWASHPADAMRYLCLSLPQTRDGLTPEELRRQRHRALYGHDAAGTKTIF